MTTLRLALCASVLMTTTAHAQRVDSAGGKAVTEVRRAIDAGNAKWADGWARRDAKLVASIFADSGVQLAGSGKVIKGRHLIEDRQRTAMAGADLGVKVTITTSQVWLDGATAYETGSYKYEYVSDGKPGVDEGTYITIWKRQRDGSWKLSMDMGIPKP